MRKLFLLLTLTIIIIGISATKTSAQTVASSSSPVANPGQQQNLHEYTQNVLIEIMAGISCQLTGVDPIDTTQKCLGINPQTKTIGYTQAQGGAIGTMGNLISLTFDIPLSSQHYYAYMKSNFGLAKPAYAQTYQQGVGFEGFKALLSLWLAFRNFSYLLFVIIFILLGLGIMFRIQISDRVVMTVQNQIPKIIISILLITFSYSIAGFLVDLMWVFIYLFGTIISQAVQAPDMLVKVKTNLTYPPFSLVNELYQGGIWGVVTTAANGVGELMRNLTTNIPIGLKSGNVQCSGNWIECAIGGAAAPAASTVLGWLMGWVIQVMAILVLAVAIFAALFRLWFQLLKTYIFILLDVVFSPFWIMSGLFPGGPGFGGWLRNMIANLSVFPSTIAMFMLGYIFMEGFNQNTAQAFIPPLIGNPGTDPSWLRGLIGVGIILITPGVGDTIRNVLKAPQIKLPASAGQNLGTGQAVAGMGPNLLWRRMTRPSNPLTGQEMGPLRRMLIGDPGAAPQNLRQRLGRMVLGGYANQVKKT